MIKVFATNLVVSKGYEDNPALKFFGEKDSCVQFRVGEKVYDANAENNTRWVNHLVKAFGAACERIKKMQLKAGSLINITGGTLKEDVWSEGEGDKKVKKSTQFIELDSRDSIEFVSGGKKSANDNQDGKGSEDSSKLGGKNGGGDKGSTPENSSNFEGYQSLGGDFFDDEA